MWKNKLFHPKLLRVTLVILLLAIAYFSLTPKYSISVGNDKVGHLIAYTVLMSNAGLLSKQFGRGFGLPIMLTLLYGVLMEFGQHFVPGRDFSFLDILANSAGVAIGSLLSFLLFRMLSKTSS